MVVLWLCRVVARLVPRVREGDPADQPEQAPAGHAQPPDGAGLLSGLRQGLQVKVQHARPPALRPLCL